MIQYIFAFPPILLSILLLLVLLYWLSEIPKMLKKWVITMRWCILALLANSFMLRTFPLLKATFETEAKEILRKMKYHGTFPEEEISITEKHITYTFSPLRKSHTWEIRGVGSYPQRARSSERLDLRARKMQSPSQAAEKKENERRARHRLHSYSDWILWDRNSWDFHSR